MTIADHRQLKATLPKTSTIFNDTRYEAADQLSHRAEANKVDVTTAPQGGENDGPLQAAMSATGLDIDNDHADERPIDRSQDAPVRPDNIEQDDEPAQAQTIAAEAEIFRRGLFGDFEESVHGGKTDIGQITPDDGQDIVDRMNQMERSGHVDMDAYRGERSDDDEATMLGEPGMESGDVDDSGIYPSNDKSTHSL